MTRKHIRYRILTLSGKLAVSVRITVDQRNEFRSFNDTSEGITLSLYPNIELQIIHPRPVDENGNTIRVWNPNDTLVLSNNTLPLFMKDLDTVMKSLQLTEMYVYTGERLDLNSKLAEEKKRIFRSSPTFFVEIIPTVLELDEKRMEGLRFTFNKEPSVVALTLSEIESLTSNLKRLDANQMALQLYQMYAKTGRTEIKSQFPPM